MSKDFKDHSQVFEVPNFSLQKGGVLPVARLVYKTVGQLSVRKDNVILVPSWFAGTHREAEKLLTGPGRAIDPDRHFIVFTNALGGGVSSSPSNTPPPFQGANFPVVTIYDNVNLQHQLLTQVLHVNQIRLIAGWSMGAVQGLQWAVQYPDMVEALAALCGAGRTAIYTKIFVLALKRALSLDPAFNNGFYIEPPVAGLKAFAAIYAGWGLSEPFYRKELFRQLNATTYEEFVENFWEPSFLRYDANDLFAMLKTWDLVNVSDNEQYKGNFNQAVGAIKAKTILMPCDHDRYFPPVDNQYEASHIPKAECRIISSEWGHMTLLNPADRPFIDQVFKDLLNS